MILSAIAALGEGQADVIRKDLQAQAYAGLYSPHTDAVRQMLANM